MDIKFRPATMRLVVTGMECSPIYYSRREELDAPEVTALDRGGYEYDEAEDGSLLIGVPANHDTVFTVGRYTITLDI